MEVMYKNERNKNGRGGVILDKFLGKIMRRRSNVLVRGEKKGNAN